ncbi:MAG TPA: glycosyltransferase [Thermomicrobiales bacterium]|nr:glycosyltransferase [Thermomicrobiales bacterium]
MRVAFLSEHASPVALLGGADAGGQNVYVDEVSRGLAARGIGVDVFTRRDAAGAPEVVDWAPGVRVINLEAGPAVQLPKDDLWPLMPAFRDAFLRFMLRSGVRYDLLHGNFWMSGWVAIELRRALGIPAVQLFHATGLTKRRCQGAADTSPADRIEIERRIVREVDRVIAQCPSERDELVDGYGAPPPKVELIPAGVNIERFRPMDRVEARSRIEASLGIDPDDLVVVYVGRMLPRKDIRNVLRAFALLIDRWGSGRPPLKLLLVGGETAEPDPMATPEIGELRRLAADLGVAEHVRFTGQRQPDVLHGYYGAGDVVVTTPWYEPFGLTPLEAMACGRPVIGSAVGGIPFTVEEGVTGCLVPPRDPEALAGCLQDLLRNPARRAWMGSAARARVERRFTWPITVERTVMLYQTVVEQRRSSETAVATSS